jgi:glycine C-acetyltransferase
MSELFLARIRGTLQQIRDDGFHKPERVIASPQAPVVRLEDGRTVLNLCANNYLGLAGDPRLVEAGKRALDSHGYGMASVRFICGTQSVHKELESALARFLRVDDCILYSSCFDANAGLFETLLGEEDAVISDELNHASIVDGIRLCKARRYRYRNNDMADLEAKLRESDAAGARFKLIATDGVFSMDGSVANLRAICDLAARYDALTLVDDSHAVGFVGERGAGTPELCGVDGRIDILTGTLGKALGGASGGYTAGRREIVELLRQRSRPYLFSNSVPPMIAGASLEVLGLLASGEGARLRAQLRGNAQLFRSRMTALGFDLPAGSHPIIPVMLGDALLAARMADALLDEGVYVIGFSYPVVPKGKARIRTQMSAAHTPEQIENAAAAFAKVASGRAPRRPAS